MEAIHRSNVALSESSVPSNPSSELILSSFELDCYVQGAITIIERSEPEATRVLSLETEQELRELQVLLLGKVKV